MRSDDAFVGIDLGGTDIKAVVLGRDGSVLHSAQAATDAALGRDAVLDRLTTVMTDAVQSSPRPVVAGGFAIPGVLDPETGTVELLTNFTPEWAGFGLREAIQARTELPVYLLNDVRAAT
ncbi:MAG TPA: ROK family protein, partial [Chloroflexota bacterium]|nr:ROK family protein [Chloroflexota bacterium]